jgi:hypothetical protein
MIRFLSTLAMLSLFGVQADAASLRTGGGIIIDKSIWGAGLAMDFHAKDLPLALTLYTDHYNSSLFFTSFYGVNVLAKAEVAGEKTLIYLGGGIGGMRAREKLYSQTKQSFVFNLTARIRLKMTERIGFFSEVRHNLMSRNSEVDMTGLFGLSINLGK